MNKYYLTPTLVFLFNSVFATFAMADSEPNDSLASANEIVVDTLTSVQGTLSSCADNDFYKFYGITGDTVTVDIDNGAGGIDSVNTYVAIFDEEGTILRSNDDGAAPDEFISTDSYLESFSVPNDGYYFIGVTNYTRPFINGGTNEGTSCDGGFIGGFFDTNTDPEMTGDYLLNVTYTSNQVSEPDPKEVDVFIQLSPGKVDYRPINPRSWGIVKVAILSRADFDAPVLVDQSTLTFGATGDELQNAKCRTKYVNRREDRDFLDLVCKFEVHKGGFTSFDEEAIVKGKTIDGRDIIGRGHIKLVKRHRGHHEKRHHDKRRHRDDD